MWVDWTDTNLALRCCALDNPHTLIAILLTSPSVFPVGVPSHYSCVFRFSRPLSLKGWPSHHQPKKKSKEAGVRSGAH